MTRMSISVKNLKEIVDMLGTIVSEVKFKLEPNGISVTAVDPAHVAMISLDIPKKAFSEYDLDAPDEIAVDLDKVKSVIRLASSNDTIVISKDRDKLRFEIGTIIKSISLLDNSSVTTPRVPQISSEDYVIISKSDFEKGLRAAEDVSDAIRLTLTPESFSAKSASDSDESEMLLPKDMLKDISCSQPVKSSYPLEYLLKLVKSISSNEDIKIAFKSDYPLSIEFSFNSETEPISGRFLLAPRMES